MDKDQVLIKVMYVALQTTSLNDDVSQVLSEVAKSGSTPETVEHLLTDEVQPLRYMSNLMSTSQMIDLDHVHMSLMGEVEALHYQMTNGDEEVLAHNIPPIKEITLIEKEIQPDGRGGGTLMTSIPEKRMGGFVDKEMKVSAGLVLQDMRVVALEEGKDSLIQMNLVLMTTMI